MVQHVDQIGAGAVDHLGKTSGVVARVRGMVQDGTLREGDALPSTRALAAELGVARGTVVAAYDQLDGEGWIRTRHGAVARVASGVGPGRTEQLTAVEPGASDSEAATRIAGVAGVSGAAVEPGAAALSGAARVAGAAEVTGIARGAGVGAGHDRTVLDCRPGIPAVTAIAAKDWRAAWRAAAEAPLRNAMSAPSGLPELRAQVAGQLGLSRGFAPAVDRVIVTAGTSEAISLVTEALRTVLGRAPRIAVEDPGYRSGHRAIRSAGGEPVGVRVDDDGLDLTTLAALVPVDAVMVTPTHQYPLGSVMPVARRRALLEWAARTGTVVLEDDYDSEFRHRGSPVPALAALDVHGVVLHLGGFSKTFDPRLRCAYVVLPVTSADAGARGAGAGTPIAPRMRSGTRPDAPLADAVAEAVRAARTARGPVVAEPVQVALAHLLRTGALRRHLGRVRRDYTHRRERIVARLTDAPGVRTTALSGGLHAVVTWSSDLTGREVVARMAERGVLVSTLEEYGLEPGSTPAGVVLGYGGVTLTELDRALDALVAATSSGAGQVLADPGLGRR